jgi:arylsulfatase A-like enzyme
MSATQPNILFIVVDDCGYADLGCTGQTDYATPTLDRLASEGVRFTQAYANAPLCTNTRVALITGRYQYRLPIGLVEPLRWSDRSAPEMGIPPGRPTLPALLRDAGYRTTLIGKWHLGYLPRYSPLKSGYDEFFGIMGGYTGYYTHIGDGGEHDLYEGETPVERQGYVTDMLSERAVAFVEAAAAAPQPYFLSLHYTAPHWPWSSPSVEAAARQREVDRAEITEGGSTRIYGEMMQILDAGIGRVIAAVQRTPGERETFIIFTSDNGGERFSKIWPFVGRKFDLLEGGIRVPQICWWPGRVAAGAVTNQVCITMDLTATCLAAAGVCGGAFPSARRTGSPAGLDRTSPRERAHPLLAHGQPPPAGSPPRRLEIPQSGGAGVSVRPRLRSTRARQSSPQGTGAARRTAWAVGKLEPRDVAPAGAFNTANVEPRRDAVVAGVSMAAGQCRCSEREDADASSEITRRPVVPARPPSEQSIAGRPAHASRSASS